MTTKAHKLLTGADLHEPKGVAAATAGQVYKADGLGSGSWQTIVIPTGLFTVTWVPFTTSGTWTKPDGCFMAKVIVIGGGGGTGSNGGTSSFGAYVSATGTTSAGATPGAGSGGDQNFTGGVSFTTSTTDHLYYRGVPGIRIGRFGESADVDAVGAGGAAVKYLYAFTSTVTVSVGAAGTGAQPGIVVVEQYVSA